MTTIETDPQDWEGTRCRKCKGRVYRDRTFVTWWHCSRCREEYGSSAIYFEYEAHDRWMMWAFKRVANWLGLCWPGA